MAYSRNLFLKILLATTEQKQKSVGLTGAIQGCVPRYSYFAKNALSWPFIGTLIATPKSVI